MQPRETQHNKLVMPSERRKEVLAAKQQLVQY